MCIRDRSPTAWSGESESKMIERVVPHISHHVVVAVVGELPIIVTTNIRQRHDGRHLNEDNISTPPHTSRFGLALKADSANLWHRHMGHINGKNVDVLRKEPGNGVDDTGSVKDCDSCLLGKSTQQPHPKQATYGVLRPFQLTTVDTLGHFQPQALGGFRYATKFVDQKTKWKEIYLMKDKTHSVDSLALFNKVP